MPQQNGDAGTLAWLSPTAAAKLLACPASVENLPTGTKRPAPPPSFPRNSGSLAHLAVQRWIESGTWRSDHDCATLVALFREEAEKNGIAVALLPDGRTTEARLEVQGPALAESLAKFAGSLGTVEAEVSLYDDGEYLWGTIDLLVHNGQEFAVLDLKTGEDAAGADIPESIKHQLWQYALLVSADRGTTPKMVSVFSLRRGLRPVDVEDADLLDLRIRLNSARQEWLSGARNTYPSPDACRFCSRRLRCEPHWSALKNWDNQDGVEGVVKRIDQAANGLAAVMLSTDKGIAWISEIPALAAESLEVGKASRAVRVRQMSHDEDSGQPARWRATEQSALSCF